MDVDNTYAFLVRHMGCERALKTFLESPNYKFKHIKFEDKELGMHPELLLNLCLLELGFNVELKKDKHGNLVYLRAGTKRYMEKYEKVG